MSTGGVDSAIRQCPTGDLRVWRQSELSSGINRLKLPSKSRKYGLLRVYQRHTRFSPPNLTPGCYFRPTLGRIWEFERLESAQMPSFSGV